MNLILFCLIAMLALLGSGCSLSRESAQPSAVNTSSPPQLSVTSPANRLVFQRDLRNQASIPIRGVCSTPGAIIEARLRPAGETEKSGRWQKIGRVGSSGNSYHGSLAAKAGWYSLDIRARSGNRVVGTATVDRVGIGEVFIIAGHSVAQGGDINLPGATDDRVNTIALWPAGSESDRNYDRTGDSRYLPPAVGAAFSDGIRPAPFGHGTYFWARFGEHVARDQGVPVLVLNAAFGGTSLEHWAKSARGESFEHGFVKSGIRMPYINVANALRRYAAVTGVRAILSDQGQNDSGQLDEELIFANYKTWIEQARRDLGFPGLVVVINRQTPYRDKVHIRRVQERMIREYPFCVAGPDYDQLADDDRYDRTHLSRSGAEKAARLWANALDAAFFRRAVPYIPSITSQPDESVARPGAQTMSADH